MVQQKQSCLKRITTLWDSETSPNLESVVDICLEGLNGSHWTQDVVGNMPNQILSNYHSVWDMNAFLQSASVLDPSKDLIKTCEDKLLAVVKPLEEIQALVHWTIQLKHYSSVELWMSYSPQFNL